MGTSGSYAGSGGGDWGKLREELDEWLNSLPNAPEEPAHPSEEAPLGQVDDRPDDPDEAVIEVLRPLATTLLSGGRGSADGPSGGAGIGVSGRPTGGGRSPSGTGRSRARVGRVGGQLASGIAAFRSGNAAVLVDLGLDLAELRGLDPVRQAQRIVAAATGEAAPTTLEEEEVQTAANRTAIWALTEPQPPDIEEIIRRFVVEYVYEVFLTEGGTILRSGDRDGVSAVAAEDRVKATIAALAREVAIDPRGLTPGELTDLVEQVYQQTLRIHKAPE
jgi:hypothetical protein